MIWPFYNRHIKTNEEIIAEQERADRARADMDEMQARLEKAVQGLMRPHNKDTK